MLIFDQMFLVSTSIVSVIALWHLANRNHSLIQRPPSEYYHGVALAVLGIAALLLTFWGWGILGIMGEGTSNKLVAIVSSLIPFSWATAFISKFYPKHEKVFLGIMILGLILITASRFMDAPLMARIVYPVFHSTAAIVVIATPIIAVKKGLMNFHFLSVSVGGALISAGGISMAFLSAGKQLLFFSQGFVLMILAPLLFSTGVLYYWGLSRGENQ
ncbi:MAG: hypothetical protein HQ556_01555 [Candidatus Marinimicrobia bacterium]|nr:hypothetical protein [Candidatus Neomarinimicrobiota bacterium]